MDDDFAIDERGDPDGFPVINHHGTPAGKLLPSWWQEPAERRGLRMIGFDRPGYGERPPRPGRRVVDVVDDVLALADRLGFERFATIGGSGGGPHALATAACLPDRVVACVVVAGVAPYEAEGLDFLAGMGAANVEEFGLALQGAEALEPFLRREADGLQGATPGTIVAALESLVGPADRATLDETFAAHMIADFRDALGGGIAGWRDDDIAFTQPWGFELGSISVPVSFWQGEEDLMVPAGHAPWLAQRVPGAELHVLPGEGHLSIGVRRQDDMLDWIAARVPASTT